MRVLNIYKREANLAIIKLNTILKTKIFQAPQKHKKIKKK